MSDSLQPHGLQHTRPPSITNSRSLFKLISIESSDAIQPSYHLSSTSPTFSLSQHPVFSNESVVCIRWPKYWSSSFNISPSKEDSVLFHLGLSGLIYLKSKGFSRVSPIPQFKSINSLALSFLYGPTLISTHNYWKNHSFE